MTLLLAFFVVMYAISSLNTGKYRVVADALSVAFNGSGPDAESSVLPRSAISGPIPLATIEPGGVGIFLVAAAVAGITDMDAIAMSTAREVADGAIDPQLGVRAVLVALLVNTVFKLVVTRVLGGRELFRLVLPALGAAALVALAGVFVA